MCVWGLKEYKMSLLEKHTKKERNKSTHFNNNATATLRNNFYFEIATSGCSGTPRGRSDTGASTWEIITSVRSVKAADTLTHPDAKQPL